MLKSDLHFIPCNHLDLGLSSHKSGAFSHSMRKVSDRLRLAIQPTVTSSARASDMDPRFSHIVTDSYVRRFVQSRYLRILLHLK